jgi:Bacterial Ig-like domain (group 3)/MBG domain (YGX type)/Beta-propeller repeat
MSPKTALCFLFALFLSFLGIAANAQAPSVNNAVLPRAAISFGKLPLSFEPNRGQTSNEVQWLARGPEYTLYLAGHDAVLEMNAIIPTKNAAAQPKISESGLRMNLLGANRALSASGEEPLPGKANYFTGKDPSKWQRDVPMYGKVRLGQVYPGIDLVYYGRQGRLEYDFVVAPGADASAIRMSFDGAKAKLAANGDLVLPAAGTEIRFDKPVVYQMKDGVRQPVEGSFTIAENQQVSFKVGSYDTARELVIDPTLIFLGTLGTGNQQSAPNGMAVDAAGEILLTGITNDLNFPVTSGALQTSCAGYNASSQGNITRCGASSSSSGFVTKISADGTSLVYSTYLHGLGGGEYGDAVVADAAGDAYVLGMTSSNDFPITADAFQSVCQPYYPQTSPTSLSPNISAQCNGFFNGGGTEYTVEGPTLFIAKLNPAGSALLYSTFFGGTIGTYPVGLALDSSNNIYFASFLQNAEPANNVYPVNGTIPFPVTASAYQSSGVGVQSATLSKLSADGHTLMYSTLMGTVATNTFFGYTEPLALAVGQNGMAYIGGVTLTSAFPTTPGVVRPACVPVTPSNGDCIGYTAFLSAFDTTKSGAASLVYSTYLGGTETSAGNSTQNQVNGLAVDSSNNVYVTGFTNRIDYPTTSGVYQATCGHANAANACGAAFLSKINPTGTAYVWSTYLGGTNANPANTQGNAIVLDAKGRVYLYGQSGDGGGDFPVVNPLQGYFGGNKLFVAAFSADATQLLFSTRLGNTSTTTTSSEQPIANNGIAVDAGGNIYVSAETNDGGSLVTTPGTYTTTATGGFFRGFFAKISPVLPMTATTLTIAPSTAATGQKVTFSVTVAGTTQTTPVPSGTVTLTNGNTTPATVLGTITLDGTGAGSFSSTTLAAGSYSVTASYSGDTTYDTSAAAAQTLTINSLPATTTTLSVSPTGALTYGQQVTLTATVTQTGGGIPTGTVTFTEGTIVLGTGTLNGSGVATLTVAPPAGVGTFVATYGGSSSAATSTGTGVPVTVALAALMVKAANVSRVIGAANPTLTGTVTGTVNNDVLTVNYTTTVTAASPAGTYPIVAAITGANIANYNVTLTNGTLTVTPATASTTALTVSASTVVVGASVTFTATVTAASGTPTPTGVVTFKDGTTALGTGTLNATEVATFASTTLAVGSHSVTASYAGDTSNAASVSSAVTVVVTAGPPDFSLLLTPTSGTVTNGTNEVLTVTVTPTNGFNAATSLACSGLPSFSTCSFNPASVTPSGAAATSTLTIASDVKAAAVAMHLPSNGAEPSGTQAPRPIAIAGVVASLLLLPLAGWRNRKLRKLLVVSVVVFAAALATAGITGCGASTKTAAGTYTVTVTGTSGSLSHTATYSIAVQ